MFANTLRLVEDCGLTFLHVFPFSPRARHAGRAHAAGGARGGARSGRRGCGRRARRASKLHLESQIGARHAVLVESDGLGRTPQFTQVVLAAPAAPGALVEVTISGHDGRRLIGEQEI